MGVGDVAVHVLDLGQVLLCYLDQLSAARLLRELRRALVLGGRVLIMVPVLLWTRIKNRTGTGQTRLLRLYYDSHGAFQ